jgi:hypothetical protein
MKLSLLRKLGLTACALAAMAPLARQAVAAGPAAPAAPQQVSTSAQRREVGITVYNSGFGLVREVREVDLANGRVALEFADVASQIQPETVAIQAQNGARLRVIEQNYRYDLLSPQKLLEKYVGQTINVYRYNEKLGHDEKYEAKVLSVTNGQPVLEINHEITYDFPGRLAFPRVPDNLIAHPTLVWLLDAGAPRERVEVTYLTQGMSWKADYVMVINDKNTIGDLTGWVTLTNNTGASYENAQLNLVAGDVQRVTPPQGMPVTLASATAGAEAPAPPQFHEEGLFEYHLYKLDQPATVLDNEQKQITLLHGDGVAVKERLVFYGQQYWYRSQMGEPVSNQKVGVFLEIENKQENHLGIPLPKGIVRVYKADSQGSKQFIGEDQIDHTPRDEKLRIKMGDAFDVVGDRKQMTWTALGDCASESTWEISLRNHKDTDVEVEDVEPIGGDWTVTQSSLPWVRKDAFTFTFTARIPARKETKITYTARVRWC